MLRGNWCDADVIRLRARYDVICYCPGTLRNPCHANIDVVMPLLAGSCSMSSSVIGVGDQTVAAARVLWVGRWESLLLFLRSGPGRQGSVLLHCWGVVGCDGHGGLHAVVHQGGWVKDSIKNVCVRHTLSSLSTFTLVHHSRSPCVVGCLIVVVAVVVHVAFVIACCYCSCCCCCSFAAVVVVVAVAVVL